MSDLISRQALRDAMYHEAFETDSDMQKWDSGCWIRYKLFENTIDELPSAKPEIIRCERTFQEIIVEYPSISTYPEYEGKPYFSIKYTENGQGFIGYGTYKPEVLSEYLKEYFMPTAERTGHWVCTSSDHYKCSNCGTRASYWYNEENSCEWDKDMSEWLSDYCPNCGSRNEVNE